jgi:ATP-dependent DNA helicase RecQ
VDRELAEGLAMTAARDVLRTMFGLDAFRPGQEEVIGHLLAGRSAAAIFPTGSGKSLCYQLPALLLSGLTLVVSPLIALMKEQIDRLRGQGIAAERLDSTRTAAESAAIAGDVRAGRLRILFVAPERIANERFRTILQHARISLFAVDEAHCISEWGHNFRPDYLKLAKFAQACRAERVLALTATATPRVLDDICAGFGIAPIYAVRTGFHRPNLTLLMKPVSADRRDDMLIQQLKTAPPGPVIVYATLQRTAEAVADLLAAAEVPARAYHAGMEPEARTAVQDWFAATDHAIVVATIAFGMGIDKRNIRSVYHYNLPKSLENLAQEIGRAGRDGLPARCETYVCPDDLSALENFVYGDTPSADSVLTLIEELFGLGAQFDVSVPELSANHDLRPNVLNTLLTYLELDGLLEAQTPFFASYRFRPLKSSAEILTRFSGERRQFLAGIFRQAVKAKIWFTVDVTRAARVTASPRERVISALQYLDEQQLLEIKVDGVRHCYKRLKAPANLRRLAESLHRRALEHEQREIGRLRQVLELATHNGCQVSHLGAHFGEPLPQPCGHCSWCLNGRQAARLCPRQAPPITEEVKWLALALQQEQLDLLRDPRRLTRFLCGVTSPWLSRAKLTNHPRFGCLQDVPFGDVLAWASSI